MKISRVQHLATINKPYHLLCMNIYTARFSKTRKVH